MHAYASVDIPHQQYSREHVECHMRVCIVAIVAYLRSEQLAAKANHKPEVHWNDLPFKDKLSSIDTWYYSKDGETAGPLGEGAILHLFKNNKIASNTLIYNSIISKEWILFEQTHLYRNHINKS